MGETGFSRRKVNRAPYKAHMLSYLISQHSLWQAALPPHTHRGSGPGDTAELAHSLIFYQEWKSDSHPKLSPFKRLILSP